MADLFKRKANRLCTWFKDYGPVPVATERDDKPVFLSAPPQRIGDDCLICVEGQYRNARLLQSCMDNPATYLVDMGPARIHVPKPSRYVRRDEVSGGAA